MIIIILFMNMKSDQISKNEKKKKVYKNQMKKNPNYLGKNDRTRGGNSCSHVRFVLCRFMSIRLYGSTLTRHVY